MAEEPAQAVQTIGRFRIQRELGRGAQGTVYLAEDTHLQRCVAVKTLRNQAILAIRQKSAG